MVWKNVGFVVKQAYLNFINFWNLIIVALFLLPIYFLQAFSCLVLFF